MYRIFCSSKDIDKGKIIISDKEEIHHIKDVLRLKIDDKIKAFDDNGKEYDTVIEKINSKDMLLKVRRVRRGGLNLPYGNRLSITVACAIPKNVKFDDLVDKLTQLGVDKIIPLDTERGIVKLDEHRGPSRIERWRKIAKNAANQSKRDAVPIIEPVKKINDLFCESGRYGLKLIPTLEGRRKTPREVFEKNSRGGFNLPILILIGPEGDFSPAEVNNAINAGFIPVTLGDTVLRVDTAAIAAVSFIKLSQILP